MNNAHPAVDPFPLPQYDNVETETQQKPTSRRKAKSRIYYKEDFAGLWVFVEVGSVESLLAHFVLADDKRNWKDIIDAF